MKRSREVNWRAPRTPGSSAGFDTGIGAGAGAGEACADFAVSSPFVPTAGVRSAPDGRGSEHDARLASESAIGTRTLDARDCRGMGRLV
jgi:hypothetical protein